jgi:hypothetical protein
MKTIELDNKQVKVLKELLSLDMDNIGFEEKEQEILEKILEMLNNK